MPRWPFLLLLTACASGPETEAEAARALLSTHRSSLEALGAPNSGQARRDRPLIQAQTSSLLGASPEMVRATLGEPLLRRSEGPAQVWLYAGGGCQVDIVLYTAESGPRVAHVQARAGGLAQRTEASCLRDIASQASTRPGPGGTRLERQPPSTVFHATEIDV